jgi:hypothetical protein
MGSFIQQHDVDFIDSNNIEMFNNNSASIILPPDKRTSYVSTYTLDTRTTQNKVLPRFYSETEGQIQRFKDYLVIENQNSGEILIFKNDSLVYRDVIHDQNNSGKKEVLNWAPAFDYNPFEKSN